MNVRSPVLTYWRDRVFDTFDGVRWVPGPELWAWNSRSSSETVYFPDSAGHRAAGPRYVQTYFLRDNLPDGVIPTGYDPVSASAPGDGSIVRVVSALPDFDAPRVRTGKASRSAAKYLEVPSAIEQLRALVRSITDGSGTDMDRLGRIAGYLELTHELDVTADPLAFTAPPRDFALGSSPGTSLDFATATALLGRAAGVPTRLAQCHLPGDFDPLSGTYEVRTSHRHAWVEAYSPGHGWVPFEATPRPELDAYHQAARTLSPLDSLFSARMGDDVVDAFRSAPLRLGSLMRSLAGGGMVWSLVVVLTGTFVIAGSFVAWKMAPRWGLRTRRAGYTRIEGQGRGEVLRAYFSAERLLGKLGAPARRPSQTFLEHTAALEARLGDASGHLVWLRDAAWAAAYGPQQVSHDVLAEAGCDSAL
jgi:transglutaminase-like putative cysteine protease